MLGLTHFNYMFDQVQVFAEDEPGPELNPDTLNRKFFEFEGLTLERPLLKGFKTKEEAFAVGREAIRYLAKAIELARSLDAKDDIVSCLRFQYETCYIQSSIVLRDPRFSTKLFSLYVDRLAILKQLEAL